MTEENKITAQDAIAENNIPNEWDKFYLRDVSFAHLMTRRIFNVLIVANPYDAFMMSIVSWVCVILPRLRRCLPQKRLMT